MTIAFFNKLNFVNVAQAFSEYVLGIQWMANPMMMMVNTFEYPVIIAGMRPN